jgi:hypothetical protein
MAPNKNVLFLLSVVIPWASPAQDFVVLPERVSTVECSFIRKNTYNGFSKVIRGRFYFDAAAKKAAYDYSGPFDFRFIIGDTVLYGIDKKKNNGYALHRGAGTAGCDELCASIHVLDSYLRCVNADSASRTLLGSIGLSLYFERNNGQGSDVFEQDRDYGGLNCVESFNAQGRMCEQVKLRYNAKKPRYDFPIRIVIRKKCSGMMTSDTVLISGATVNRALRPEVFALPAGCRLNDVRDAARGFFPEDSVAQ